MHVYFVRIISYTRVVGRLKTTFKIYFYHVPPGSSALRVQKKNTPTPAPVVACCRRACSTRTAAQHSVVTRPSNPLITYRYVRVFCCVLVFLLSSMMVLSPGHFFFRKLHPCCRSERVVASNHTTQHRAINSTWYTSSSWHYQLVCSIKTWASYFCPLPYLLHFSFREQRQAPAERNPHTRLGHDGLGPMAINN